MYILFFMSLLRFLFINGDVITNFDDKKDIKLSVFNFENNINTEKLQHWINDGKVSASPMSFEPPFLDFPETPIGQPKWDHVKILNEDESMSIHLYSISSSKIDFHCSLFKEEILSGGGNSSFDIVFLSRQLGIVKNILYIHTSRGTFHYKVSGIGVSSPYRIKSFFKAKIPLNNSFTSPIYFYNPYTYPIQILEMYTSGGDAHLELPNQSKQASKKLWIVPPYETRTIMRVKFLGRKVGNFTSFLRIRTNTTDNPLGFVIPLQIEVSNMSMLYCIYDNIYFGILRSLDSPKSLKLIVINSANESLRIKSVELEKPNDAVSIDFQQINVLPGIHRQASIASITFSAFKAISPEQSSGNIIIRTFQNQTLSVPYVADIIHGSLVYDANNTKFFIDSQKIGSESRHIAITNTFDFTIAIYSISLSSKANCCFKITNLTFPIHIKSKETESSIQVQFSFENIGSFTTQIAIFSNISLFVIPLFVYNGKLTVVPHRPEVYKGHLDFGTLGMKSEEYLYFTLKNENPTEVTISSMSTNWFLATVMLAGVEKGNNTVLQRNTTQKPTFNFLPLVLKMYHFAVFRLIVNTPDTSGVFASDISVVTQYENLSIPYYLRTAEGVIFASNSLIVKNCFPSKISKILMTLNSTFQSYNELTSVKFIPNDTRFSFDTRTGRNLPILIKPLETTSVGYIKFSFGNNCLDSLSDEFVGMEKISVYNGKKDVSSTMVQFKILCEVNGKIPCYVGFSTCTKLGYQWLLTTDMNSKSYDIDKFIYKRIHQQWESFQASDNHYFNVTLQMDTSNIKGFLTTVQAQLIWPSILSSSSKLTKFPLTQIGNSSFRDIYLENPSDSPVILQLILISHYYDPYSLIELLGISDKDVGIYNNNVFTLHPKQLEDEKHVYTEAVKENKRVISMLSINPHNESLIVLLLPKTRQKARVYFSPTHENVGKRLSTVLVLRNNLTSIETVLLEGQGTYGELLFQSGHLQEETSILHFELTEKHLKSCDSQPKGIIPSFTVRRPFVIKNIGKISVFIMGFQFGPLLNPNMVDNPVNYELMGNDSNIGGASFPTILENVKSDVENKGESLWCAGYGFEILECYGYRLEVNDTLKLEIVFTPDFSLHKVIQQLQVHTSLSEWPFNITVQASLPAHMLHRCSQALARPDSEVLIWYMVIVVISVVTMAAILMAYYEADRLFTSNVIYRHLSSVAIGSYPHSAGDRICDFRTFAKNSPFINTTNQLPPAVSPRSSVHDYLSIYNRNDCDSSVIKRLNICKKHDDKMSIGLTEKVFSQSFCGKSIPEEVTNSSDHNGFNPISSTNSFHQHKKKKKRGFLFGLIQWGMRSVTQILNQNTALKPRLEDKFNYKSEGQPFIKTAMFAQSKTDDTKLDQPQKSSMNFNKSKILYCNQEISVSGAGGGSGNTMSQNSSAVSTNNNNNPPSQQSSSNHSKKSKNRSSNCTFVNNQTKSNVSKQDSSTVATLNFAPIDIPLLDVHRCKKVIVNNNNNKNRKKNNVVIITEELKTKSSQRMDDSISVSTDSSTEEKIKDIEGGSNKNAKIPSGNTSTGGVSLKANKNKEGVQQRLSCTNYVEKFPDDYTNDTKHQTVNCSEQDEVCSVRFNESGFESLKNKGNFKLSKAVVLADNNVHRNQGTASVIKICEQNNNQRGNLERKAEKADPKTPKTHKSQQTVKPILTTSENPFSEINTLMMSEINNGISEVETKSDLESSDELIQWENETVTSVLSEDFNMLSERTEMFSNFIGLQGNKNPDEMSESTGVTTGTSKSSTNIENWLFDNSLSSFRNVMQPQQQTDVVKINEESSKIVSSYDYLKNFTDDMVYHQMDTVGQLRDCTTGKINTSDHLINYYKNGTCVTTKNSDGFLQNHNGTSSLFMGNNSYKQSADVFSQDFMSLELPGIAHGRKQSLLEYERRTQKDLSTNDSGEWLTNNKLSPYPLSYSTLQSNSLNSYWETTNLNCDSATELNDKMWTQNSCMDSQFWAAEKPWHQIEPGSQHDPLARILLPIGLLSSGDNNTNGIFTTSGSSDYLWKFKPDDQVVFLSNNNNNNGNINNNSNNNNNTTTTTNNNGKLDSMEQQ